MSEYMPIEFVTEAELLRIIEDYKPLGKFICRNPNGYTAVANETGHAWTEDFPRLVSAMQWLSGVDTE